MKNRLSTILWDAGGVIFPFDLTIADRKFAADCGRTLQEVSSILYGGTAEGREYNSGLIEDYNLGRMSSLDFYWSVKKALGLQMDYDKFADSWVNVFSFNEEIAGFIQHLHDLGVRQGILSSVNPLHWDKLNSIFDLESLLGKNNIVCTYHPDAGKKKPTPELFDAAMRRLGIKKEETVYVDDVEKYVQGARTYGMGAAVHVDLSHNDFQIRCIQDLHVLGFS